MTQSPSHEASADTPPFSTRGLIAMGVVLIVLGAISGCFALLIPLAPLLARSAPQHQQVAAIDARSIAAAVLMHGAIAALLITLGVASCRALRWSVPAILSIAWIWLITGVIGLAISFFLMPQMMDQMRSSTANVPGGDTILIVILVMVQSISFVLHVVIPAALILFYRRPAVLAACRQRHPQPGWTHRCPTQVVVISIALTLFAVMLVFGLFFNAVPMFGVILTGVPAAACLLVGAAVSALLAWSTARLKMAGWWGTLALFVVITIGPVITFMHHDVFDFYAAGGMAPEQVEQMRTLIGDPQPLNTTTIVSAILMGIISVVYMLRIRRHFRPAESDGFTA